MTPAGWIEFVIITTVAGCILAAAVIIARAWRYDRRHPVTEADSAWLHGVLAEAGRCPWCHDRQCMDPRQCRCDPRCGMPLCQAPETETVP